MFGASCSANEIMIGLETLSMPRCGLDGRSSWGDSFLHELLHPITPDAMPTSFTSPFRRFNCRSPQLTCSDEPFDRVPRKFECLRHLFHGEPVLERSSTLCAQSRKMLLNLNENLREIACMFVTVVGHTNSFAHILLLQMPSA